MKIDKIVLRQVRMPLVHFFETSFGRTTHRRIILVEVISQGVSGWGEVTAGENPFYNEEWTECAWLILKDYAVPRVLGQELAGLRWPGLETLQVLLEIARLHHDDAIGVGIREG